jgi:type II secretory pathway predicted ATPase ExeA
MVRKVHIVPPDEAAGRCLPLKLPLVMKELKLSTRQLGSRVGLSAGSISLLGTTGHFPKRTNEAGLRTRIEGVLRELGATPEQLQNLFDHYDPNKDRACSARTLHDLRKTDDDEEPMLSAKQTLSDEARRRFELFSNPFDGEVTRAEEMFLNGEIRFVREAAWQAAINARFVAIVGESGAGKSTILGDLKERILLDHRPVIVAEPSVLGMEDSDKRGKTLKSSDIETALIMTLDPMATVAQSAEKRTRQAQQLLEQSTGAGNSHMLVIEEGHSLPLPTIRHFKRLHERMRLGRRPMLGILLLAHPELLTKLNRYDAREVMQRLEIARLPPLNGHLRAYLEHRAKVANRKLEDFITAEGVDEMQTRLTVAAQGSPISLLYPLNVNNWMTAALNAAAEIGAPRIDRDVVRAV